MRQAFVGQQSLGRFNAMGINKLKEIRPEMFIDGVRHLAIWHADVPRKFFDVDVLSQIQLIHLNALAHFFHQRIGRLFRDGLVIAIGMFRLGNNQMLRVGNA